MTTASIYFHLRLWNPGHRSGWPTSCRGHGAAPPRRFAGQLSAAWALTSQQYLALLPTTPWENSFEFCSWDIHPQAISSAASPGPPFWVLLLRSHSGGGGASSLNSRPEPERGSSQGLVLRSCLANRVIVSTINFHCWAGQGWLSSWTVCLEF